MQRDKYQRPEYPMASDTIYHMSYPEPGQYVKDESEYVECPCQKEENDDISSAPTKIC